jgi:hypothetical protein
MAKYGSFKYGSGTKYGTGAAVILPELSGQVTWICDIDWTGAGAVNEAARMIDLRIMRGRRHYVGSSGIGLESMQPGTAILKMDNLNRRYDPYNTGSELYPYVLPGRRIRISVYDNSTTETYVIFTGHITDIQPSSGVEQVTITAEDGLKWLSDAEYNSGVVYSSNISDAINLVLSFVNWPYSRNIQSSVQPLQVFEPGAGNGLTIIQKLAEANLGAFFVDRYGAATFFPVSYNVTTSHNVDQSQLLKELRVPQPWETVRNKITVIANRRGMRPGSVIWTLPGIEVFTAGQSKSFSATFARADSIAQPVPVTHYAANTAVDGSGDDVSSSFGISISAITATGCTVTVTNNYTSTAYVRYLHLVGHEIVLAPEEKRDQDNTSISSYGPRRLLIDNEWLQDRNYAETYAGWLVDHLKDPQINPIIQIEQRPETQFSVDLMDKIALSSAALGIDDTLSVAGIEHIWKEDSGQSTVTTIYLQDILYNAASIDSDPYYPGENIITPIPFPDFPDFIDPWIPWVPDIPPDPLPSCLSSDALQNGPYQAHTNVTTLMSSTGTFDIPLPYLTISYPCTLRAGSAANKSKIVFTGDWTYYSITENRWVTLISNDWYEVYAVDTGGNTVATATLAAGRNNTRIATFAPDQPMDVAGFRIRLLDDPLSGDVITFDFDTSTDGWTPFSMDGSGNLAYCTWENGKVQVELNTSSWTRIGWKFDPEINGRTITAVEGATLEATLTGYGNMFPNIGLKLNDGSYVYDSTEYIYTVPGWADGYGVDFVAFDCTSHDGLIRCDNVILTGFEISQRRVKIVINDTKIYNVCASGLTA